MSQELYVTDLVTKYAPFIEGRMARHYDAPMEEGLTLSADDSPVPGTSEHDELAALRAIYMALVGGFLWLANMTRPDISYAASQLCRFLANPGRPHIAAAFRVLIYLDGTKDHALTFRPVLARLLEVMVDSSWLPGFSCSGALYFYAGCLFHWFSKNQRSVTLSSAEAEYFGAMLAAKDLIFCRELLVDLLGAMLRATVMYIDSKSAVDMSYDPVAFKKTKHILRAAQFLRDLVAREVVYLLHVPGSVMTADILTKAVARAIFVALFQRLESGADGLPESP